MRIKWFIPTLAIVGSSLLIVLAEAQCQCALFLVASETWQPDYLAFTTNKTYEVNCSSSFLAGEACRNLCEDEVVALNHVFSSQPGILKEYNPSQNVPCEVLPAHTASFYKSCGREAWFPSSAQLSSSVCCSPTTHTPVWCESLPAKSHQEGRAVAEEEVVMERKIDTDTDQNAIENNEIEGSTKPEANEDTSGSWMTSVLKFFGYKSIGELVQNIDIFSIPSRIQAAIKTYNDEISMGQCYMEYTTYSVFKQDGVLNSFLRSRRDVETTMEEAWEAEWNGEEQPGEGDTSMLEEGRRATASQGQGNAIQNLVQGLVGMLESSPSTRQYADIIKQMVPVVMQMFSSDDPSSAMTSFISHTLGPYLTQIQTAPAKTPNDISNGDAKPIKWPNLNRTPAPSPNTPPRPQTQPTVGSGGAGSSPIASLVLQFFKHYMGNYFASLPGNAPAKPTPRPTQPPASRPPTSPAISPSIGSLLNLFFAGNRPQSVPRPKPQAVKKPPKPQVLEKKDTKTFVDMVLEFIRPVFISIIGKAPGESGVASIREVTRLSSLGRVDDTIVEEVLSPYFCLKNYVVNKAWTLTERGVRSIADKFNPEEQARMMRMMQEQ